MDVTMICISLLQLVACAMGTLLFSKVYKSYNGSTTLTGNSLKLTTGLSAVQCMTVCAGYQHMSSEVCYAARYNGVTGNWELMSRSSTGAMQWQADIQWSIFVVKCEAGWTMFEVSCYQLFGIKKKWDDAKSACEQVNASLVSITSKEEDDFIHAYINGTNETIWIGANDREVDGVWKWESGEDWIYENFAAGEPASGMKAVLGMRYDYGWKVFDGQTTYLFYLCEK